MCRISWISLFNGFNFFFRQQERIAQEREDIEKQRKLLVKKKPNSTVTKNPKNDNFLKPGGEKPWVFFLDTADCKADLLNFVCDFALMYAIGYLH